MGGGASLGGGAQGGGRRHFDRAASLCPDPALKADYASYAAFCRRLAEAS